MSIATSADGTRIDYETAGDGPTVILICAGPNDRNSNAELAGLLASTCRVVNYDRRGRGASGDTAPYSVEREVEDLRAVADAVRGEHGVNVFGTSGGAFLAFRAAADGMPVDSLAVWEPPYILPGTRPAVPADYADQQAKLAADDRRGEMVELFMTDAVGMPAEVVAGMKQAPFWEFVEQAASPALVYDAQLAGDFSLDPDQLANVACPVLVLQGGTTGWLTAAAEGVSGALPAAQSQTLTGQPHNVDAKVLAPALSDFFTR